jgi:hypothetical protein
MDVCWIHTYRMSISMLQLLKIYRLEGYEVLSLAEPSGLCLRKGLRSSIGCSGGECRLYNSPSGSEEASLGVAIGVLLATSVPWARMSSSKCAGSLGQVPTWTPVLQRDAPQIICQYGPCPIGRAARTPVEGSLVGRRFMQEPSKAKKVSFLATTRHKHYLELHTPSANTWQIKQVVRNHQVSAKQSVGTWTFLPFKKPCTICVNATFFFAI